MGSSGGKQVVDSFDVIRHMIENLGGRQPTREDALGISVALKDVYDRLLKVRQISPTVDYSQRMWLLLDLVGFPNKSLRKDGKV